MANFKVGDRVKVLSNACGSENPVGSVGIITLTDEYTDCRVVVKGCTDDNLVNWHHHSELELLELGI